MTTRAWRPLAAGITTVGAALALAGSALALPHAALHSQVHCDGLLGKLGKAIAYPVKKAAGNASKTFNKTGQVVQYPVRKAGENTSKAAHKSGLK